MPGWKMRARSDISSTFHSRLTWRRHQIRIRFLGEHAEHVEDVEEEVLIDRWQSLDETLVLRDCVVRRRVLRQRASKLASALSFRKSTSS